MGLGNPGRAYNNTRHNVGFAMIDAIAQAKNVKINKKKHQGLYCIGKWQNQTVILLKPQAFMNNSGIVVRKFVDYFNVAREDVLIIYDDYHLEVGNYKLKAQGSSAGHKGLKSIEEHLQTTNYKRLKIGISRDEQMMLSDYVLGKFSREQQKKIKSLENEIIQIFDDYLQYDFDKVMAIHNEKNTR